MPKLNSDQLLAVIRDSGTRPLGVREILARLGLHSGARTEVKRQLRELVRARLITGEGKRYLLRTDRPGGGAAPEPDAAGHQRHEDHPAPSGSDGERGARATAPVVRDQKADPAEQLLRGFRIPAGRKGQGKRVVGVLHLKAQGYGFVSPVAFKGDDLFLPAQETRGLADGDLIEVEIVPRAGGRSASRLTGLLERRRTYLVGRYERKGRGAMVVPRDRDLAPISVEHFPAAKDGDAVRLRLPQEAHGAAVVEAVLGDGEDLRLESLSVAYGRGFNDVFTERALADAAAYPEQVTAEQRHGRRDLISLPLVTIDGEDARDFDDAVYVEKGEGGTRLLVAIADVASFVRPGTGLDVDALQRCTSVYFPDRVLPMLPERLSNGLCSLMPGVERLCLVADMVIDASGQTRKTEVYPAVMRSAARCTYTQVADSLANKPVELPSRVTERFPAMLALAETLARMREQRGAIDFNLTEQKIVLGADGKVADVVPRERNPAHRLIEAFMLAANEAVADHFLRAKRPSIFRIHDQPDVDKLESFLQLARAHGFTSPLGVAPRPQVLNAFLRKLDAGPGEKPKPEARALNALLLRSMMQAAYAERNIGHYGLGAEGYLHFTSPIRRYPDLMVHRLLWAEWRGQPAANADELGAVARRCSERERAAMGAEREIDAYYGTLWARDHVGERFAGTIDGAAEIGLFVEIDGHLVSGLVASDSLGAGAELEPKAHRFVLGRTGATLGIGDAVEVEIVSANVARRQIDLALTGSFAQRRAPVQPGEEARPAQTQRAARPASPSQSERPAQSVRSGSASLSERLAQVRREQSGRKGQSKRLGHSGRPSGKPGKSGQGRPGQRQGQSGKPGHDQSGQRQGQPSKSGQDRPGQRQGPPGKSGHDQSGQRQGQPGKPGHDQSGQRSGQGQPGGKKKGSGDGARRQGNKHRGRRR